MNCLSHENTHRFVKEGRGRKVEGKGEREDGGRNREEGKGIKEEGRRKQGKILKTK